MPGRMCSLKLAMKCSMLRMTPSMPSSIPALGQYAHFTNYTNYALNVLLEYPNPLQPDQYPGFSSGEMYRGGELFLHFTKVLDLPMLTRE